MFKYYSSYPAPIWCAISYIAEQIMDNAELQRLCHFVYQHKAQLLDGVIAQAVDNCRNLETIRFKALEEHELGIYNIIADYTHLEIIDNEAKYNCTGCHLQLRFTTDQIYA